MIFLVSAQSYKEIRRHQSHLYNRKRSWTNFKKKSSMSLSVTHNFGWLVASFEHLLPILKKDKSQGRSSPFSTVAVSQIHKKRKKKNSPCQWRCLITKENCYLCSTLAWKHPSFLLFLPLIVKIQEKLWASESFG